MRASERAREEVIVALCGDGSGRTAFSVLPCSETESDGCYRVRRLREESEVHGGV